MRTLSGIQLSTAIAFLTASLTSQPSFAQDITFSCGNSNGSPATIARTPQGEVPIIIWDATNSGDMNPQQRCESASRNFQTYRNQGLFNYITTEKKNDQLVVCFAPKENEPCTGVLFPLNPSETNARSALQRIFRIRVASVGPITETNSRVYISLDRFLKGEYPSFNPKQNSSGNQGNLVGE